MKHLKRTATSGIAGIVLATSSLATYSQTENTEILDAILGGDGLIGGVVAASLSDFPVLGDLVSNGLIGLPVANEILGNNLLYEELSALDDGAVLRGLTGVLLGTEVSPPLAVNPLLETELFESLIIGNLLTGTLAADLAPVSIPMLYNPVELLNYFFEGGTVLAPVVTLIPAIPIVTSPIN